MKPFFSYFGSRWKMAKRYPAPDFPVVVEPFAGGAGYSIWHEPEQAILVELNDKVAAVWDFLLSACAADIRDLPDYVEDIRHHEDLPLGAQYLIRFWLSQASASPVLRATGWSAEPDAGWRPAIKERIIKQLPKIEGWQLIHGSYEQAPDIVATWHIDPPFQEQGKHYPSNPFKDNPAETYKALGSWCRARRGQTMVCEMGEADWLPFQPLEAIRNRHQMGAKSYIEVVWLNAA